MGPKPKDVTASRSKRELEITWSDGHASRYGYDYLRGHCPCAGCQGHGGPHVFHETSGAELAGMANVGTYAIQMTFADGHDSGIYSYEFLRAICPCEEHGGPGYAPETVAQR